MIQRSQLKGILEATLQAQIAPLEILEQVIDLLDLTEAEKQDLGQRTLSMAIAAEQFEKFFEGLCD